MSQQTRTRVILKGFLVDIDLPSEARAKRNFKDKEPIVDEIEKVLEILPDDFAKEFARIRAQAYRVVHKHSETLAKLGRSRVFLCPLDEVLPLNAEFDTVKERTRQLDTKIREYFANPNTEEKERQAKVSAYMESKRLTPNAIMPSLSELANVHFVPFNIDFDYYKNYLEAKERAGLEELDTRKRQALDKMEREIKQEQERITREAVIELQKRLSVIIENIVPDLARQNPGRTRTELNEVLARAQGFGLETLIAESVETANALLEAYNSPDNERSERIANAAQALKEHFNLDPHLSDIDAVKRAANLLNKDLSPRARAVLMELESETDSRARAVLSELHAQ